MNDEFRGASAEPIPQEWARHYVDELIKAAKWWPEGSAMRAAAVARADAVLDMVKAFRASQNEQS